MARKLRIECEQRTRAGGVLKDLRTGAQAWFYRGETIILELGLFAAGRMQLKANITTLTLTIKSGGSGGTDVITPIVVGPSQLAETITAQQWKQGTAALLTVTIADTSTSVMPAGMLTMEVVAVVSGKTCVFASGTIESVTLATLVTGAAPSPAAPVAYTKAEVDALIEAMARAAPGSERVGDFSALQAAVALSGDRIIELTSDITIGANLIIPKNKVLVFNNHKFLQGSAWKVIIHAQMPMLRRQYFDSAFLAGQITGTFGAREVYPEWWGLQSRTYSGDALIPTNILSLNDATAINKAARAYVVIPGSVGPYYGINVSMAPGDYYFTDAVDLTGTMSRVVGAGSNATVVHLTASWNPSEWLAAADFPAVTGGNHSAAFYIGGVYTGTVNFGAGSTYRTGVRGVYINAISASLANWSRNVSGVTARDGVEEQSEVIDVIVEGASGFGVGFTQHSANPATINGLTVCDLWLTGVMKSTSVGLKTTEWTYQSRIDRVTIAHNLTKQHSEYWDKVTGFNNIEMSVVSGSDILTIAIQAGFTGFSATDVGTTPSIVLGQVGWFVTHYNGLSAPFVAAGTTILEILSTTTARMSANATTTGTIVASEYSKISKFRNDFQLGANPAATGSRYIPAVGQTYDKPAYSCIIQGQVSARNIHLEGGVIGVYIKEKGPYGNTVTLDNLDVMHMMNSSQAYYESGDPQEDPGPITTDYHTKACAVLIGGTVAPSGLNVSDAVVMSNIVVQNNCTWLFRDATMGQEERAFGQGQNFGAYYIPNNGVQPFYARGNKYSRGATTPYANIGAGAYDKTAPTSAASTARRFFLNPTGVQQKGAAVANATDAATAITQLNLLLDRTRGLGHIAT